MAALSFGGPAGQIAVMHRILVDELRWVSETRFLHALNYCMLLPGPEAQQLATYLGWLLHGGWGGLTAGLLFVLPGFVSILVLSVVYASYGHTVAVAGLFYGLKPAVVAVVVQAVVRIGKRALKNSAMVAIAAAAFVAIFFFEVPFPWIIAAAAAIGLVGGRLRPDLFVVIRGHGDPASAATTKGHVLDDHHVSAVDASWGRTVRVAALWLVLWWAPIAALWQFTGRESVYTQQGLFFSKAAMVTFGGAYAVLPYVADQCVNRYGWLAPNEMLDGLGMAETTPGPLIQVVQFVGFMGAYRNPGELSPLAAGIAGSIIATWATYAPCFLWIFVGAPHIENLRGKQTLSAALSAITAAVVGVILNLSIWFAIHALFRTVDERHYGPLRILTPEWASVEWGAAAIALFALAAIFRWKWGMLPTLGVSAAAGLVYSLVVGI